MSGVKAMAGLVGVVAAFLLARTVDPQFGGYVGVFGVVVWVVWALAMANGPFRDD